MLMPPPGTHLATSGDGGEVLLWEPIDAAAAAARRGNLCEDESEATWRRCAAFKGHSAEGDVMDLCWAPDGTVLASGAIDNEAYLFVAAGRKRGDAAGRFKDHKHFVQVGGAGRVQRGGAGMARRQRGGAGVARRRRRAGGGLRRGCSRHAACCGATSCTPPILWPCRAWRGIRRSSTWPP